MKYVLLVLAALAAPVLAADVTAEDVAKARAIQERRASDPAVDNTLPREHRVSRDEARRAAVLHHRQERRDELVRLRAAQRIRE
jgi:hypothetical protein